MQSLINNLIHLASLLERVFQEENPAHDSQLGSLISQFLPSKDGSSWYHVTQDQIKNAKHK